VSGSGRSAGADRSEACQQAGCSGEYCAPGEDGLGVDGEYAFRLVMRGAVVFEGRR
jgi:hypothetical protein